MTTSSEPTPGITHVRLERTIDAVYAALPEGDRAEFSAVMRATVVAELPHAFESWYRRAVLAQVPGLADRINATGRSSRGEGVPVEEVIPDFAERLAAHRAGRRAA